MRWFQELSCTQTCKAVYWRCPHFRECWLLCIPLSVGATLSNEGTLLIGALVSVLHQLHYIHVPPKVASFKYDIYRTAEVRYVDIWESGAHCIMLRVSWHIDVYIMLLTTICPVCESWVVFVMSHGFSFTISLPPPLCWYTALLSFVIGLVGVVVSDRNAVMERGFFQGYSATVVIVISLQVSWLYTVI